MVMNVADALSAYKQGGTLSSLGSDGVTETGAAGGGFTDMLKEFGSDAVGALKEGEKAATASTTGKADIASVVTALSNAEMMLQTVVVIRDKVIAAYQDITKTAI